MPKKISNCTKGHLVSVPLPNHGATYTVISHQFVIDYAYQALATAGFSIVDEEYRCTADGQIAQGIYRLNYNSDPELTMMFAWTNSYNKQVKFKCVVGAYSLKTGSTMISGEVGSWVRKHTGTADTEVKATIDDYVTNAHMYYNQLVSDKAAMELVTLNKRKQSQLLGVLFAEYEILTTEQASLVRDQMKKPIHVFANTDSLWAFYNFITHALQSSHPKTWMEDQRILHYFIGTICDFSAPPQPVSTPPINLSAPVEEEEVIDPLYAYPGQTNILDQIADLEADQIDEDVIVPVEYLSKEEILTKYGEQLPDNQVVQQDPEMLEIVHQVEEILETLDEAEEDVLTEDELAHQLYGVDNDIEVSIPAPEVDDFVTDEEEDAVLDEILVPIPPCAGHDAETEREIEKEISEDIFPQVKVETVQLNETTVAAVVVTETIEDTDDDFSFDLDFDDDTEEEGKDKQSFDFDF
jgi:hypothetical protein